MNPIRYRLCTLIEDQELMNRFKRIVDRENLSMNRVIEQFLFAYAYCMDSSFMDISEQIEPRDRRKPYGFRINEEIYNSVVEKVTKEKVKMSLLVERFLTRYLSFMEGSHSHQDRREGPWKPAC